MDDSRGAREFFWFHTLPKRIFNEKMTYGDDFLATVPIPPLLRLGVFFLARRGAQSGPRFLILRFLNGAPSL